MEHLMHGTKDAFVAVLVATCLVAGVGGAAYYTLGPDGWLTGMAVRLMRDPNLGTLASLALVIAVTVGAKRWLDRRQSTTAFDNLIVGVVALIGFAVIVQGIHAFTLA